MGQPNNALSFIFNFKKLELMDKFKIAKDTIVKELIYGKNTELVEMNKLVKN